MNRSKQATLEQLCQLQQKPSHIRNICILAHVDHGKTTLADALVASNGIISKRNAGKIRYMDSRADEQERGITMKSSAITLLYEKTHQGVHPQQYLINLIDSPGHVDFSSEVSTAVRLCDGAVVVVDVVEGVCPQTQAVLRQAWLENIRPMLVLNKMDRLISELKFTPLEAYYHLIQVLEQVNLITNQLFISEAMDRTSKDNEEENEDSAETNDPKSYDWTVIEDEEENKNIYFSPELGNVVFASAYDGWGFSVKDFARMYAAKLGTKESVLLKTLWGDYFINMKSKRIVKGAQSKGKKPLFVQFALENIWAGYDAVLEQKDSAMTEKIVKSLGLTITTRDTRHKDPRILLQAIMSQWLPLSDAVLDTVVTCTPSPLKVSEERVEALMCSQSRQFSSLPEPTQSLKSDFLACSSCPEAPVILYVSKMFPMERKCLPQHRARPLTEEELRLRREEARRRHAEMKAKMEENASESNQNTNGEVEAHGHSYLKESNSQKTEEDPEENVFIAFARVFSGTVRKGQTMFFLGPKHDPGKALADFNDKSMAELLSQPDVLSQTHITAVEIKDIYLLMGRELETVDEVPAGNVLGIGGLEESILKSGTLATTLACPAFTDMYFDASPIVRVAVESAHACDMSKLIQGLRLLNQADPCVEVRVQETGEHVIIAAGEVHLQRCIDDLRERYAKVEVNVSKPIVPFRETLTVPPKMDMVNETILEQGQADKEEDEDDTIQASTADRQCHLLLRAAPLPGTVADILLQHQETLKALDSMTTANITGRSELQMGFCMNKAAVETLQTVKQHLKEEFEKAGGEWVGAEDKIWSFGPRRCGPNILLNCVKGYNRPSVWLSLEGGGAVGKVADFDNSVISGFQIATLAGPLCEEPMHGVCFMVEDWWYGSQAKASVSQQGSSSHRSSPCIEEASNGKDIASLTSDECNLLSSDLKSKVEICDSSSGKVENGEDGELPLTGENGHAVQETHVFQGSDTIQRQSNVFGPLSGQLISTVKEGCRRAFQAQPQRLMAAMYKCEVQATMEVLGKLHGVLSKRYGQVLSEEMQEGTDIFNVTAALPVVESFGFSEDIRKKTSGLASPQLKFSHWEMLTVDPFWVPTTEEEYTHFGEKADAENKARLYMNKVRKRKGLRTDEKIVEFAEKQRTLTKMK
ncbi:elongation factor-like GTPase 1 [Aplysia californica]|uniref:Elongation factor-like GTPase 1 n=1 Tax=Aplysia californica TaxID=6500 RepID=A0ABM0JYM1_APLCA|nr:elongation factor-like GTPase 1 [Aplysia californica]